MLKMITTCVNYGDYLNITLPYNYKICDKIYVITSKNDIHTQEICSKYSDKVICMVTDVFFENDAVFNKGKGLNLGLKEVVKNEWVLISDADIILPQKLNSVLFKLKNKQALYSSKRIFCEQKEKLTTILKDIEASIEPKKPWQGCIKYPAVGYFQLFNSSSRFFLKNPKYREDLPTAASCDLSFSEQWPKDKTLSLKLSCVHLGKNNQNWCGRTTSFF